MHGRHGCDCRRAIVRWTKGVTAARAPAIREDLSRPSRFQNKL
jgi:hypothetical protein